MSQLSSVKFAQLSLKVVKFSLAAVLGGHSGSFDMISECSQPHCPFHADSIGV